MNNELNNELDLLEKYSDYLEEALITRSAPVALFNEWKEENE